MHHNLETSTFDPLKFKMVNPILIVFSLTVKPATLIFTSGRGLAISSAKEGKSGFIYKLVKKLFEPRKRVCIS